MFKTQVPHIVDVKPSNACNFGCSFCYENSTPEGSECDPDDMVRFARMLNEIGTYELSIGGGDPCFFWKGRFLEELYRIIKTFSRGYVNVTTFNASFARKLMKFYRHYFPARLFGIGFSIHGLKSAASYIDLLNQKPPNVQLVAQHVWGSVSFEETIEMMQMLSQVEGSHLLLLGFKKVGRGETYNNIPIPENKTLEAVKYFMKELTISVDSLFVKTYPVFKKVFPHSTTDQEGLFSCYVDISEPEALVAPGSYLKERGVRVKRDELLNPHRFLSLWKRISD